MHLFSFLFRLSKANLDAQTAHGYSAIHHAARKGNLPLVKMLLDSGCNINLEADSKYNSSCHTPLHEAISVGQLEVVKFLIQQPGIQWGQGDKGETD